MDLKCLILPGLLVAVVGFMVLSSISGRLSQQRERSRQAWLNTGMKGSKMYTPAPVWEPGQPVFEEHVPVPVGEFESTETYIRDCAARKERQRQAAVLKKQARVEKYAQQERVRGEQASRAIANSIATMQPCLGDRIANEKLVKEIFGEEHWDID